jgi:hypothetical protein
VPLQLHCGQHCFDALTSRKNGLLKGGLESLIGVDQLRMLVFRRGNSRA